MPLSNLNPSDTFDIVELKLDATIDKVNEIDTGLPEGTTGQVLTKNSNADYDYDWATPASVDISGKLDIESVNIAFDSGAGPTSYTTETTLATVTPHALRNSFKMKFSIAGYVSNPSGSAEVSILRIKKAGVEIWSTRVEPISGQTMAFSTIFFSTYTAGQVITLTAEAGASQNINNFILSCEAFDMYL